MRDMTCERRENRKIKSKRSTEHGIMPNAKCFLNLGDLMHEYF